MGAGQSPQSSANKKPRREAGLGNQETLKAADSSQKASPDGTGEQSHSPLAEFEAIKKVHAALSTLEPDAQARVVNYIFDLMGIGVQPKAAEV
jgi:hypothetical protein